MEKEINNKKILKLLKENKELIIMVPTVVLTFLGVLYEAIHYFYSLKAEQFYGIPKFYFYDNSQADYVMNLVLFMATIMIFFSPYIVKRKNKLKFFESLAYSFLFAILVFYFWLSFCISFIMNTLHITGYDYVLLGVCIVVAIISWVVYFFAFKADPKEHSNIDKQETKEDKNKKDAPVDLKTNEIIIVYAHSIVALVNIIIVAILIFSSALFNPDKKKNYEIIPVGKLEYSVIVGYYKDSAIIMEGEIDYQNSDSNSHLKIKKGYYKLESIEEKELIYYSFDLITCED